jgi:hypothetical protein
MYIWRLIEGYDARSVVMAVLDTAIHVFIAASKSRMAETSPNKSGHDGRAKTEYSVSHPPSSFPDKDQPPTGGDAAPANPLKFSKKQLAFAVAIAGVSDVIGAFTTPAPPVTWAVDLLTALLLFVVLGRQWLLLPGLALEAIPGLGVIPFWLLVVGAIAAFGTPRPTFNQPR